MKKSIYLIIICSLSISCTNNIKSEPYFVMPKYLHSKEHFTNKIMEADSVSLGYAYASKSNFFSSSSVNKLVIEVYYDNDTNIDAVFMKNLFENIKENAKKEIENLYEYDILALKTFKNKTEFKNYEEIIKK